MQKNFRMTILAIGSVFLASSLALAAQTAPPPAPDAGTSAPQHHARAGKTRKHSAKKGARKKGRKKSTSTEPK
jgi:hypothetical protein